MRTLTASDRVSLIKLASSLPKGDETRKAILAGLQVVKTAADDPKKITSLIIKEMIRDSDLKESDIPKNLMSALEKAVESSVAEGEILFDKNTIPDIVFEGPKQQFAGFKSFKKLNKAIQAIAEKIN